MIKRKKLMPIFLLMLCLLFTGCAGEASTEEDSVSDEPVVVSEEEDSEPEISEEIQLEEQAADIQAADIPVAEPLDLEDIPEYSGEAYVAVNDNEPDFTEDDLRAVSFETYSELDELGRCGTAYADIGEDLMPVEKRGSIGKVKPSGWHSVEYDIVEGKSLYNRCHLIGYQLTAENANENNLITGTRYLNTEGMLPFENMVADYIKETDNHVLYRVTPVFEGDNLVASGVQMEGMSVEDKGGSVCFNVYCYNVQPGIIIDYKTGESRLNEEANDKTAKSAKVSTGETDSPVAEEEDIRHDEEQEKPVGTTYILNTNTRKFHKSSCSSVKQMKESNTERYTGSRDEVTSMGYDPCKRCSP